MRELSAVDACDLLVGERRSETGEPALVLGVGILRREDQCLAAGGAGAEHPRSSVVELLRSDLEHTCAGLSRTVGASILRPGVDDQDLDLLLDLLPRDRLEAPDEVDAPVLRRDDDRDQGARS